MKKTILTLLLGSMLGSMALADEIRLSEARFQKGDDATWKEVSFDDSKWGTISNMQTWSSQGKAFPGSYVWYRFHFRMPKSMLEQSDIKELVRLHLGKVDDADQAFLNGKMIGHTGGMPDDKDGYASRWDAERIYDVPVASGIVRWDEDNVLAVRVYNAGEPGGMFDGPVRVKVLSTIDGITLKVGETTEKGQNACAVAAHSVFANPKYGDLTVRITDPETEELLSEKTVRMAPSEKKPAVVTIPFDNHRMTRITATFRDRKSGLTVSESYTPKYILTPKAPDYPRFNTTDLFGVRPGSPIHFRFGVSGMRPMRFTSEDLPEGVSLCPENGALSGSIDRQGSYTFTVRAENAKGFTTQRFTIRVGSKIALTPPMGWNSWNCWGLSVTQDKVISSAKALIEKGLADYGYCYMNIDDGWEAPERNADGTIGVNGKFPSMKDLGDWLHSEGLKFGIYSSPGNVTCGGYLGSLDHEMQDAESYNSWGIDYLKYDWCGYTYKHDKEVDKQTVASYVKPYMLMEDCLRRQPRDIFYSLCQYGMADVWKWGYAVDANSWRTTGDITDTWSSLYDIGFNQQAELYPYAQPGHWNDPDMLIVGKVGWSDNLRDSRLTADEQYTHITLWTLLASNMLIGCDIAQMDDFTLGLLCNNEVNAVNQDILGRQAKRNVKEGDLQIWSRPLSDGTVAVGIFNLGMAEDMRVDLSKYLKALELNEVTGVRDLWRQQDLPVTDLNYFIPRHGVKYIKVRKG